MKNESIIAFAAAQAEHLSDLYDQGFAAGVLSLQLTAQDQKRVDAVIAEVVADVERENTQIDGSLIGKANAHDTVALIMKRLGFGTPPAVLPAIEVKEE